MSKPLHLCVKRKRHPRLQPALKHALTELDVKVALHFHA